MAPTLAEVDEICQYICVFIKLPSRWKGWLTESLSARILVAKGYQIVAKNRRFAGVEVDILAKKNKTLVVVEVKYRRSRDLAHGALLPPQQVRLSRAASTISQEANQDVRVDLFLWQRGWPFVEHIQDVLF